MPAPAAADKITPNDPRVEHRTFTTTSGTTYHHLLATPPKSSAVEGTVLLCHGWPDLSIGWRYQIPYLLSLNLRVVVPDQIGYGRSSAPLSLESYTLKNVSDDIAQLMLSDVLANSPDKKFIIGGHDWGGFLVWRFILYHPHLVQGVFSVCTPYSPPREKYLSLEEIAKFVPSFQYQVQLASGVVDSYVTTRERLTKFFHAMFGAMTVPGGGAVFSTERGVDLEALERVGKSPILTEEEVEFYVDEYFYRKDDDKPLRASLNWYRTTRLKWEEELALVKARAGTVENKIQTPALMVVTTKDVALPPTMARGMEQFFADLVVREMETGHWALVEDPEGVNGYVGEFVKKVLAQEKERKTGVGAKI